MADTGVSDKRPAAPARWLIFAPVVALVGGGVAYHNAAHLNVNLACFSGALLYLGVLFLLKAELVIAWFQPGEGHSATATRWLGGGFAALGAWQLCNALMH
jgi:hypothetical protein